MLSQKETVSAQCFSLSLYFNNLFFFLILSNVWTTNMVVLSNFIWVTTIKEKTSHDFPFEKFMMY